MILGHPRNFCDSVDNNPVVRGWVWNHFRSDRSRAFTRRRRVDRGN